MNQRSDIVPKEKFPVTQYQKNCPAVKIGVPNGKVVFVSNEVKIIKVDDNTVEAYYDGYKQTITAEGSGNERYNFKSVIEEYSVEEATS